MSFSIAISLAASNGAVTADAAIVGAGFAGLSAALALQDAGLNVVVLEAAPAVGGRASDWATATGVLNLKRTSCWSCEDTVTLIILPHHHHLHHGWL